jgi:hypothetical protein
MFTLEPTAKGIFWAENYDTKAAHRPAHYCGTCGDPVVTLKDPATGEQRKARVFPTLRFTLAYETGLWHSCETEAQEFAVEDYNPFTL